MNANRFATPSTLRLGPGHSRWAAVVAATVLLTSSGDASARGLNVVSDVAVREQGNNTVVKLRCATKPMFSVFKLERPRRLTIDLANARLSRIGSLIDVDSWAVSQIATTQFRTSAATIARVMINFRRRAHYTVRSQGSTLVVTVMPHKARPIAAKDKRSAKAIAKARKDADTARRQAAQAAREARRAQTDVGRLAREAAKARAEAQQARKQANSAKSKMAKLSKEARKRSLAVEQRARHLRSLADTARRDAATARAKMARAGSRVKQLEREAAKARKVGARAQQLALEADRAKLAAKKAREETAKARRLVAKFRGEAQSARATAARERANAARKARALASAKQALAKHDRALKAARGARGKLQQQLVLARGQVAKRQQQVEALGRQVQGARRLARNGSDKHASARLRAAVAALRKARKAAARSERSRTQVARALTRAEARTRTAEHARRQAESARERAESARRLALAARTQAELQRKAAEKARLAAESSRSRALRTLAEEQRRRRAAESARVVATRKAAQLTKAIAVVKARRRSVGAAERRVRELESALALVQRKERTQRQRVASVEASLKAMRLRARRAESKKSQLAIDVRQARTAERQQARALTSLRRQLRHQQGRATRALALVGRLTRARDVAKRRVAAKRGAARQRAEAALARAERQLRSAESAQRKATREHRSAVSKVASATRQQRALAVRLRSTQQRLADAARRLTQVESKVRHVSGDLSGARARLARVATKRRAEEQAKRRAKLARVAEEQRLLVAKRARRGAEQARKAAHGQLGKLQQDLQRVREARKAEQARLARLRRSQRAAKAKLVALEAVGAKQGRARQARKAQLSRLGAELRAQRSKLAQLKKRWAKPTVKVGAAIRNISFADKADRAEVQIRLRGKPKMRVQRQGQQLVLAIDGAQLPRLLQRTLDTKAFKGPVESVSSFVTNGAGGRVYIKVDTKGRPKQRLLRRGDLLVWRFDKPRAAFAAAPKRKAKTQRRPPSTSIDGATYDYKTVRVAGARTRGRTRRFRRRRYSGRRIDLDFKGADIHNILRLLSQVGSVNIVTSDDVRGKVTIRMRNVPWDQALDVILRAKGLGQVREGNLVRVAPMADLEKEREAEIARRKQLAQLQPLETRLVPLSYADAQKVLPKLRYTLSPRGKLTFDERTNMVIARDVSANLNLLEKMIRNLDTQTPQVMIEARIIEARSNYTKELGVQWGGTFQASAANGNSTGLVFPNQIGIGGGATDQLTPASGLLFGQNANPNFAVNLPATTGLNSGGAIGLTLGSISGAFNINLRLSAAETKGDIRIVSAPRITTLDNVEASIEQGVTIPYSQVSAAGTQTIFKDAKLNLTVKPHVTADGSVVMKVAVQRNEVDFVNTGARGQPTILKKEAKTEMLVKDGDTAVIGGIYTTRDGRRWQKVPWFADIPIIGWFFKNRQDTSDREEVLVFITPRIINRAQSIGR
jgi:type IV pilus assembly protein PilQ